jgi:GR25 family glycosyltransferase involved in LPS biosynthesis
MSHFIDRIFYINLDRRTDRFAEIQEELQKYGLDAERFSAIPHAQGIVGCGYSHLSVMKIAKDRGYKNILILEDDFMFSVSKDTLEERLAYFFTHVRTEDYDVCMLSYQNAVKEELGADSSGAAYLSKLKEASNASAYIINGAYLDTLIALYEHALPLLESTGEHWNYANDQVWKQLQRRDRWFAFTQKLGIQRAGYSDNSNRFMDYTE